MSVEPQDEDIDRLFQLGTDPEHTFVFKEQAWEQMEALLEKDDRRRKRLFWWWFGGVNIVLFCSVLIFGKFSTIFHFSEPRNIQPTADHNPGYNAALEKKMGNILNNQDNRDNNQDKQDTTIVKNSKTKLKPPDFILKKIENSLELLDTTLHIPLNTNDEKIAIAGETKLDFELEPVSRLSLFLTYVQTDTLSLVSPVATIKEPVTPQFQALFMGLMVAGEGTSAGFDHFNKLSWKLGGQIAFRYQGQYSLEIGAHFIRKLYEAGKGEYIPPKGFWTRKIAPIAADGICDILEIPVSVGFFPGGMHRSGLFFTAGISSYFMLKERYQYVYDITDSDLIRTWGTTNKNRHLFNIGQLSGGYNKIIGKTSIQFGPYLQAPFSGIGHGNVKLWSIGVAGKVNFKVL